MDKYEADKVIQDAIDSILYPEQDNKVKLGGNMRMLDEAVNINEVPPKVKRKLKSFQRSIQDAMNDYSLGYEVDVYKLARFYIVKVYTANHYDLYKEKEIFELSLCNNGQIIAVNGIIYPWLLKKIQIQIYNDLKLLDAN